MNIQATLLDYRCCGEDKLKRPEVLKGLKAVWELPIIKKHCKVYELTDGAIVLYMGELFCKQMGFPEVEDMTLPLSALAKKYPELLSKKRVKGFVYADAWCTIYERNEGYIRVEGLREAMSDIFRLKIGPIQDALYRAVRDLSLKDYRFLRLGIYGCEGADSADYRRMCDDIVDHYYIVTKKILEEKKNGIRRLRR